MIDPEREELIHLADAPRHPLLRQGRRPGKPINRSTIERWINHGARGVRLETVRVGTTRFTSDIAIRRFFNAINGIQPGTPTPAQVRREHEAADRQLVAADI